MDATRATARRVCQVDNLDPPGERINQPVFLHAVLAVPREFEYPITPGRSRREHLHDEVRRPPGPVSDDPETFCGDEDDVWLQYGGLLAIQHHIDW